MSELLLVRHCESTDPAPDSHLTEAGFGQAEQLASYFAKFPIDAIHLQPLSPRPRNDCAVRRFK